MLLLKATFFTVHYYLCFRKKADDLSTNSQLIGLVIDKVGKMQQIHPIYATLTALFLISTGCEQSNPTQSQISSTQRQQTLDAIAEAERESQNSEVPASNIVLATPPGWSKSEIRPLPPNDHGFTVAYEHESGLAVTLYQFTRGLTSIPDDVNSAPVKDEMQHAKIGIEQAVQLGYWQAAKENESRVVQLGDSKQQALWSQYQLTSEGMFLTSDIYVWARSNTLFKVRCTSRSEDVSSNQAVLAPLLTAFGSPDTAADN